MAHKCAAGASEWFQKACQYKVMNIWRAVLVIDQDVNAAYSVLPLGVE